VLQRFDGLELACDKADAAHQATGAEVIRPDVHRHVLGARERNVAATELEARLARHPGPGALHRLAAQRQHLVDRVALADQLAAASHAVGRHDRG